MLNIHVSDPSLIKPIKTYLEERKLLNKQLKIRKENGNTVIPSLITDDSISLPFDIHSVSSYEFETNVEPPLEAFIHKVLGKDTPPIPKKYTLYHPLVLFNNSQVPFDEWELPQDFFPDMLRQLFPTYTHVAINKPIIESDVMRRPFNIVPLYGEFSVPTTESEWDTPSETNFQNALWCHVVQNNIHQFWAPVYTMFSRGNIKEKARVLTLPQIKDHDVIDLYAGIGYFTLSYLAAGARNVFCFELNPWSIQGLRKGLVANKFQDRCHVFNESNIECPKRLTEFGEKLKLRHINMGLLPTSQPAYPLALGIIRDFSVVPVTTLHIHENVHVDDLNSGKFVKDTLALLKPHTEYEMHAVHCEKIKTFAPDVWHVCLDVDVYRGDC